MSDRLIDNPKWQAFASSLEQDRSLPSGLLNAIALNETNGGDPLFMQKPSSAGAQGMFQFMPDTAKQYNVNVSDRADSTRGAADYLADLVSQFKDPRLAAAAYNWGPGNLNKAIAKAKAAGLPIDATTLADKGYLPKETADYVRKLPTFQAVSQPVQESTGLPQYKPEQIQQTRQQVADMVLSGMGNDTIVANLERSAVAPVIKKLTDSGYSTAEIVQRMGGQPLSDVIAAKSARDAKGGLQNTWDGAKAGGSDLLLGAKQIIGAGDEKALRQEAADNAANPDRRVLMDTTGGKLGYIGAQVAPLAALDIVAPEIGAPLTAVRTASVIGRGTALGAAQGALTPTTEDGQRASNATTGALIGGGVTGAVSAAGAAARGAAGLARGIPADEAAARIAAAEAQGLPVGAADIAPNLRGISDQLGKVPLARTLGGSGNEAGQEAALAREISKRFGQNASTIDSDVISTAQRELGQNFDNALAGVAFKPSTTFGDDLDLILKKEASKLPSLQNKTVKDVVDELKTASSAPLEAKTLQSIRSDIGKRMSSQSLEPEAKQALGDVSHAIESELQRALPTDKLQLWKQTNDQWRHLQAAENLVRATNDTGEGIAKKLASAIKQGSNRTAFERGQAPYQDLLGTINSLNPSGRAGPLDSVYQVAGGVGAYHNPAVLAGVPIAAGLRRLLNSTNPAVRNLLLGIPTDATEQAASLTRAITGRSSQMAVVDPESVARQRAISDALAQKAAIATQAAGLVPQVPVQQVSAQANQAAMQQALARALAQKHRNF